MNHTGDNKKGILIRSSLWFFTGLFYVNKIASQLTPHQECGCNWSDECYTGSTMLYTNSCWWEVVGEEIKPTNQWTLINNQHILLIMDEYHPVASLITIQSWYGKAFLQKEKETFRETCWPWKLPLVHCFFFSFLSFITVSNFRKTLLMGRKALCEGIWLKEQLVFTKFLTWPSDSLGPVRLDINTMWWNQGQNIRTAHWLAG